MLSNRSFAHVLVGEPASTSPEHAPKAGYAVGGLLIGCGG
jgi:hypothetical protein